MEARGKKLYNILIANYASKICQMINGENCHISKPSSYNKLIAVTKSIVKYWFEVSCLPSNEN